MKTLFLTLLLLFTVTLASAQDYESENKQIYQEILEEQLNKLDLSQDQEQEFIEISKRYEEKALALKTKDISKWSKFKEFKSLIRDKNKEVENLIDKEKFKIYQELQKNNQKKMKALYKQRNG